MTDTHPRSLYRVLRLLASIGIFAEGEQQQFEMTPMASYLQTLEMLVMTFDGRERAHR